MSKAKEYRDKNLHEGKWIESDEEFKRFLDAMNHKTLEDVKELIEKEIKRNQRIKKASITERTNTIAQSRINQLSEILTKLEKLKL